MQKPTVALHVGARVEVIEEIAGIFGGLVRAGGSHERTDDFHQIPAGESLIRRRKLIVA
jgi:hypothetical protein